MVILSLVSLLSHTCEDDVYNFINSLIEESKYYTNIMKKHFNKLLIMTKKDEDFENFTKFWFCDNIYVDGDVIVREKN